MQALPQLPSETVTALVGIVEKYRHAIPSYFPAHNNWRVLSDDAAWLLTVVQVMVVGSSAFYERYVNDEEAQRDLSFSRLLSQSEAERRQVVHRTLRALKIRYAGKTTAGCRKTKAILQNLNFFAQYPGGPTGYLQMLSTLADDDARARRIISDLQFIKNKGARDFLCETGLGCDLLALDVRVLNILRALGATPAKDVQTNAREYKKLQDELIDRVCNPAGITGAQLDRVLYRNYAEIMLGSRASTNGQESLPPPKMKIVGVCERDIDLLLLEEFVSSVPFLNWFSSKLDLPAVTLVEAGRGVATSFGESDLLLTVQTARDETFCIHIENKIDADFQPQQAKRYEIRGEQQVTSGQACDYFVCLVAPKDYTQGSAFLEDFDLYVSYEEILPRLGDSALNSRRKHYKTTLLQRAIEKGKHGSQLLEDATVTQLWRDYWQRTLELAPALQMERPSARGARSSFVYFWPADLPAGVRLVHKLTRENADLQLPRLARSVSKLRASCEHLLEGDMRIDTASKSAVIRIPVPLVHIQRDFASQREDIDTGILACLRLYNWVQQHRDVVVAVMEDVGREARAD